VAAELRAHRYQQSIATNPDFKFMGLRHVTAFAEASFGPLFFTDGRRTAPDEKFQLDMVTAERFFKDMRMPEGFHRPAEPIEGEGFQLLSMKFLQPGRNQGAANTFVKDNSLGGLADFCTFYAQIANVTVKGFYPNPTGVLRRNLMLNLQFLYENLPTGDLKCPQVHPYGQD
jgi:unspecific peroxygenase